MRKSAVGAFDALVKQGAALESRSRHAALAKAGKARDAAYARAGEARDRTVEAVTHLERVFEQRVSKAISKLGVPTAKDVDSLIKRVDQLAAAVAKLSKTAPAKRAVAPKPAAAPAAKKAPAKRVARKAAA